MFQIIGIVVLFAMVFGSYIISGGKFEVILHALPHEMMAIGGAGIAAFLISNSPRRSRHSPRLSPPSMDRAEFGRYRRPLTLFPADQDDEDQGLITRKPHENPSEARSSPSTLASLRTLRVYFICSRCS